MSSGIGRTTKKRFPVEVISAISDVVAKTVISILVSVVIALVIWGFLDGGKFISAFVGGMIAQVILRVFDKEFRKNIEVTWLWFKEQPDFFPSWVYGSKKEKQDMDFLNVMNNMKDDSPPPKKSPTTDLKESANKSLLDD